MGWQSELEEIYRELDGVLSRIAPECRTCGRCCHFKDFGHTLYTSSLEVNYLLSKAEPPNSPITEETCPYLLNNLCAARGYRLLGCRMFYCNKGWQETSQDLYEKYYRRIKELAIKYNLEWRYAPMHQLLAAGETTPHKEGEGEK